MSSKRVLVRKFDVPDTPASLAFWVLFNNTDFSRQWGAMIFRKNGTIDLEKLKFILDASKKMAMISRGLRTASDWK